MENTLKKLRGLIRMYRLKKGYSQENMADFLSISQAAYANLENGNSKLAVDKLLHIVQVLDVPREEFMAVCNRFFKSIQNTEI